MLHEAPPGKAKVMFTLLSGGGGASRLLAAGAPGPQAWLKASLPEGHRGVQRGQGQPGRGRRDLGASCPSLCLQLLSWESRTAITPGSKDRGQADTR